MEMSSLTDNSKQRWEGKREELRPKIIFVLTLLLVVAISVSLFFFGGDPERLAELKNYGYLGAFLVSLISNTSIILPIPGIIVLSALGATLNPVLVGLIGAVGGVIGEITGFGFGYSGRGVMRGSRLYIRAEKWMRRWGGWAVFVFAAVPLPVLDIAGVVAGVLGFPLRKFLLVVWVGKSLKYVALVSVGAWGWEVVLRYFS
jgi:membrane protein YqaA with SNARE-associated domain